MRQLERGRLQVADIAIVVWEKAARAEMSDQRRTAFCCVSASRRNQDKTRSERGQAVEGPNVFGRGACCRIEPDGDVKWACAVLAQRFELANACATDSVDSFLPAVLDKLRRLAADQEQTGRRELARNNPREVRSRDLKRAPLHVGTL